MPNVKFSDFTAEADINAYEGIVGYNTTGNLNLYIAPLEMPARYDPDVYNVALGGATTLRGIDLALAGTNNIGIGISALPDVTTALDCIAIGKDTLFTITTSGINASGQHIAIGNEAQYNNGAIGNSGDENVAIGHKALYTNPGYFDATYPGMYNVAVGGKALEALDSSDRNTAIGHNVGNTLFDGWSNTLMGFEAGANPSSGLSIYQENYMILIGQHTVAQGDSTIAIGHEAEIKEISVGTPSDYSITIGAESSVNVEDSILIGSQSTLTAGNVGSSGGNVIIGNNNDITTGLIYVDGRNTIIGNNNIVEGEYNTHVGYYGEMYGEDNASIGYFNTVYGENCVGIGDNSFIGTLGNTALNCVALGGDITIPGSAENSMLIGAGSTTTTDYAFEVGFNGSAGGAASMDVVLVGAGGPHINMSKLDLANDLVITTNNGGSLQVGNIQTSSTANAEFNGPVTINHTDAGAVSGVVSPDFTNGNIITWTLIGDVTTLSAPTINAMNFESGSYIMIIKNPGGNNITGFDAAYKWPGGIGAFPGLSTGTDIITWVSDDTDFYGSIVQTFS